MSSSQNNDETKAKLNLETSRIRWHELQTYYARGQIVRVGQALDLLDVACELTADNRALFEQWLANGDVGDVSPDLARTWYDRNTELWAVVVAPWVLVQDRSEPSDASVH
ncbi:MULTISPECIES: DUF2288 domain-containing protein [Marinobacter]|uniref:DUF2288 domain-containing protein n=1 Tax=Marinobacter xiaoshiensis TaxID=3073652 RepID=A0ABU2HIQ0_9GAMM|nr:MULTISPECIES: DUF2288 domain-containing protein [unclassified Marinobacter]MBK1886465.1 DUF2288 domain-containing protein [Marinobacter sp. DY40_1A1]MDS1310934.1 DUF2288 domain-containing protein [Marinobacter sp. F60267]